MKIHYYCYYVEDIETKEKYLFDIRPFLEAFTSWKKSLSIATKLTNGKEHLYLFPVQKNYFLFVQTKANDVIQMIETKADSINTSELAENLDKDKTLGFASYVLFDESKNLFAFSSRLSSPRVTAFKNFFNDMFMLLNEGRLHFVITQMKNSVTKSQATSLQFVGRTEVKVNKDNSLFNHIADHLMGETVDRDMIETIEVIIKPALKQNIRQSVGRAINRVEQTGLEGIVLKGKDAIDMPLRNYYITSTGGIFDEEDSLDSNTIRNSMSKGLKENELLHEKIKDYENDDELNFSSLPLERLEHYYDAENWPSLGNTK